MSCPRTIPCDFSPNLVSSFLFKINSKGSVATYADIVRLPLLFTLNRFLLLFEDSSLWMNFRGDILIFVITKLISCMYFSCCCCFFYLGFLSRTLTNHRSAGEGREHFFNSSLPLPHASQTLRY